MGDGATPKDEVHLAAKCISWEMWRLIPCTDCGIEVQMPLTTYRLTTQCNSCTEHIAEQSRLADEQMTRTIVIAVGVAFGMLVLAAILALR